MGLSRPRLSRADPAEIVTRLTTPARPPLVGEITLRLAGDVYALWEATERENTPNPNPFVPNAPAAALPPPFWGFPWAGGQALARYLLDHPGQVRGRSVLDLASGSGLVAIAAAKSGGGPVTASDPDPLAVAAIWINCAANSVELASVVGDVLGEPEPEAQVVLAGDAFYERAMARRMLAYLRRARARGAVVLIGDPDRAYLPRDDLAPVAAYDVPVSPVLEDCEIKRATVWRMR
jgi:predicted nicotinamide N-methyase